jgi:hypothetical protein
MLNTYGVAPASGYFATDKHSSGIGISESFEMTPPGDRATQRSFGAVLTGRVPVGILGCHTLANRTNNLTRAQFSN